MEQMLLHETGKQLWNSQKTIKTYAEYDYLLESERLIFDILKDRMANMRMLDLGVGGGRTTVHFAPRVKEYLGSDYAENMVEACQKRFGATHPEYRFEVVDATDMKGVPDQYFDFVLFSFNSIDCVPPENRHRVLVEVRRVGKPGAFFAFSAHNIRYLPHLFSPVWDKNPKTMLYKAYRAVLLRYHNGSPHKHLNGDYAWIRNGAEQFSLTLYYGKPELQVKQLQDAGFRNVRAFTDREIPLDQLREIKDKAWIHYLCEV